METDPLLAAITHMGYVLFAFPTEIILPLILLILLIISSALISGSEVAFFSLSPNDLHAIEDEDSTASKLLLSLKEKPRALLATILISNNFINISIVLVSNSILRVVIGDQQLLSIGGWLQSLFRLENVFSVQTIADGFNFIVAVIGVTAILVLFGEVAPKIYANLNNLRFAKMMSRPLKALNFLFGPISRVMVGWSQSLESRLGKAGSNSALTSKKDIDKAIELTVGDSQHADDEADMLKSIVKFGDVSVKQIMLSRIDVKAVEKSTTFKDLLTVVKESGFSRLPVYTEDFDNLDGILYAKDLLGHTNEDDDFNWQVLIRDNVLYVPESKKIDDLLREFQSKRTHMAIVVDEYGGSSGIVTLEDIMEEIIGEIKDEFDEDIEVEFIKLEEGNFIFEGKTLLNDVCRIIGESTDIFDGVRGDADSLGGLIVETLGRIPKPDKEVVLGNVILKVVAVTRRRVEKVNVRLIS